jgi:hypothetical protein
MQAHDLSARAEHEQHVTGVSSRSTSTKLQLQVVLSPHPHLLVSRFTLAGLRLIRVQDVKRKAVAHSGGR